MIDEIEETEEMEQIVFEDNSRIKTQKRIEENRKSVQEDINAILLRKERIQEILRSDHGGAKLSGSVWPEQNIFENTEYGRIYSMSDVNLKTLIDFHTNTADIIMDPFAGYLNTAEVVLKMERRYLGYEIFEPYYKKLKDKIDSLVQNREAMGLHTFPHRIFNKDSQYLGNKEGDKVDMILTTIPDPIFPDSNHKTQEMIIDTYQKYLEQITKPLIASYELLKDNGFFVVHCKDSVKGFVYRPTFMDIGNILREHMPLKYTLILADQRSPSGTLGDNGEMFKLYSEQTFPYSHQYVLCFYKGEGRLR